MFLIRNKELDLRCFEVETKLHGHIFCFAESNRRTIVLKKDGVWRSSDGITQILRHARPNSLPDSLSRLTKEAYPLLESKDELGV